MIKKLVDGWNALPTEEKVTWMVIATLHIHNFTLAMHRNRISNLRSRVKELEAKAK